MIKGLHHNAYRCRDSEETRKFYEDFLGLPLVNAFKSAAQGYGIEKRVLLLHGLKGLLHIGVRLEKRGKINHACAGVRFYERHDVLQGSLEDGEVGAVGAAGLEQVVAGATSTSPRSVLLRQAGEVGVGAIGVGVEAHEEDVAATLPEEGGVARRSKDVLAHTGTAGSRSVGYRTSGRVIW